METPTNPFVFVVGCPRSGTTLLQRMLDAHPQLAVANDTHFITRAAKAELRKHPRPRLTQALVDQVLAYRRFRRMGLKEKTVRAAAEGCDSYAAFVARLYDLRAEKAGKPLSGEKTPDFCRQMPALHALFPRTRFIHIVRDGRNTTLSTVKWATPTKGPGKWGTWAGDPVGTCALWWRWQTQQGLRDGTALPDGTCLEIRYEDLVAAPEAKLGEMARFLGLPYAEEMARYHAGKTRDNPQLSAKSAWLPPTQGLRDWKAQMGAEDITVFEGVAGDLLNRLGYPLSGLSPSDAARNRVRALEDWWRRQKMAGDLEAPVRA